MNTTPQIPRGAKTGLSTVLLGLVIALAGCGGTSDVPSSPAPAASTTAGATAPPTGATSATAVAAPSVTTLAAPSATAVVVPSATTLAAPSATAAASPNGGTPIRITVAGRTITATLNDSAVAQDFAAMLPVTLPWFRNYGIEYITELAAPLTETGPFYTDVRPGDIVYYNPLDSVTIIYKPTSSVPTLTKMGTITSDLSVFADLPDKVAMLIERR